ncbi:electron-transfer-flavoprotein - alpha polypeptide [Leishmania donovani]|uniref:Electron transfer flavoprotein subunit alpha n=3 Tax=Leishmania donovani species complex TaxID=38574 RepID=A0A6L0XTH5_LEIIN|nr:putative electron-transfer-flavoprotein, alpha polypeptide [Leishmania infantum JPCM5]XP_003862223.1 electron-transfer-flavoprotein, alpha polypeptide, putative [Leishmania donovani]CAC9502983.1 electron-transfer-flavoprotein_-_alpha_polypeptide_-_putative [Leishmania infantum]TPP40514.1 Electron transfer flavoprotein FAD-binding domain family protein [Leishmania donovani]TPP54261.1 Electron transfer flavoprotein FAD-binding domain family protein [Leishmania donovani]CAJ1990263.1 electron-t|eukprot:XP_001470152.1 putative electron-transfer-flavoprotein, alpha polypeptide [Leishmania infantum JPCM5]
MLRATALSLGKALVIAEMVGGKVSPATLSAITGAAKVGPVAVLVAGASAKAEAQVLAKIKSVASVLVTVGEQYSHGLPEEYAPLIDVAVRANGYTHVFAGTSAFGKNVIPRAAARQSCMPIPEVTEIVDENTFVRQTYAGNAITTIKSSDKIKYCTLRGTAFERAELDGGSAAVAELAATPEVGKAKFLEDQLSTSDKPDLMTAATVISGGRGMKNGDNFKMLEELASPLNAAVGATRAVVDAGYVPNEMQVGQTGKTVAPNFYLACGISGAIQHVAGMKDSKVIAVVNTDEEAPFFQIADYGIVDDLFKVVPALTEKVKAANGK